MSRRLLDFPPELILRVADLLFKDPNIGNTGNGEGKDGNEKDGIDDTSDKVDQESQQSDDLQANGHGLSTPQAIYNLSRTCTSLYEILSVYTFRYITLHNTEKSGQAVQYLGGTSRVANVKTLHFHAEAPGDAEENFHDVDAVFPTEVDDILGNLSQFSHLETLVFDFDFHLNETDGSHRWDEILTNSTLEDEVESKEEMQKAEEQEGWRALVKKTLEAVSRNKSDGVRELVYKDYPFRVNSVFGSENFNQWLKKMDSFRFEIYGGDTGACWKANTAPRFQQYMNNLDHFFLNALQNVTRLAIIGHEEGAIGQTDYHEALMPLRAECVPKLKELELGYYFIQDDFLDFLVAHSSTLEHLIFNHCFLTAPYAEYDILDLYDEPKSSEEPENPSEGTWNSWFRKYASKAPRALQRLSFKPSTAIIKPSDGTVDDELYEKITQVLAERRAEGHEVRVFPYGEIDDKYGMLFEKGDCNGYRAWKGWDMEGWKELREVIQMNRERMIDVKESGTE